MPAHPLTRLIDCLHRRSAEAGTSLNPWMQAILCAPVCRYQLALSYVDEELMMQLEGRHLEAATAARTPLLLNSAACELRRQNWHAAIAHCQEVRCPRAAASQSCCPLRFGVGVLQPDQSVGLHKHDILIPSLLAAEKMSEPAQCDGMRAHRPASR